MLDITTCFATLKNIDKCRPHVEASEKMLQTYEQLLAQIDLPLQRRLSAKEITLLANMKNIGLQHLVIINDALGRYHQQQKHPVTAAFFECVDTKLNTIKKQLRQLLDQIAHAETQLELLITAETVARRCWHESHHQPLELNQTDASILLAQSKIIIPQAIRHDESTGIQLSKSEWQRRRQQFLVEEQRERQEKAKQEAKEQELKAIQGLTNRETATIFCVNACKILESISNLSKRGFADAKQFLQNLVQTTPKADSPGYQVALYSLRGLRAAYTAPKARLEQNKQPQILRKASISIYWILLTCCNIRNAAKTNTASRHAAFYCRQWRQTLLAAHDQELTTQMGNIEQKLGSSAIY